MHLHLWLTHVDQLHVCEIGTYMWSTHSWSIQSFSSLLWWSMLKHRLHQNRDEEDWVKQLWLHHIYVAISHVCSWFTCVSQRCKCIFYPPSKKYKYISLCEIHKSKTNITLAFAKINSSLFSYISFVFKKS